MMEPKPNHVAALEIMDAHRELTRDEFDELARKARIFNPTHALSYLVKIGKIHIVPPHADQPEMVKLGPRKTVA